MMTTEGYRLPITFTDGETIVAVIENPCKEMIYTHVAISSKGRTIFICFSGGPSGT